MSWLIDFVNLVLGFQELLSEGMSFMSHELQCVLHVTYSKLTCLLLKEAQLAVWKPANAPVFGLQRRGSRPGARPGQLQGRRPCSGLPKTAGQG